MTILVVNRYVSSILTLSTCRQYQILQVEGSVLQDQPPPPTSDTSCSAGYYLFLRDQLQLGVPINCPLGLINLIEQLRELRKMLTFNSLLKDMIKDRYKQPYEEIQRARSHTKENLSSCILRSGSMAHGSILIGQAGKFSVKEKGKRENR